LWIVIAVVAVIVVAAIAWSLTRRSQQRRSESLREGFGPEYDRTLERAGDRQAAEEDLLERKKRHDELDLQPLAPAARERYTDQWRMTQAAFVDDPSAAIGDADGLVQRVMRERGYPVDDFEERAAVVSVDHPVVVERYRRAHVVAEANGRGEAETEDLRQAMQDYRALFEELLGERNVEARR
jgi:hypothetical protein